ncbi:MAG: carboxylesterase family protein [Pseudomonadota bacterium]
MNRRQVLIGAAAMAGLHVTPAFGQAEPVVETAQGRVRGREVDGIRVFKGLRYGASTGGENRFRPPQPPPRWTGVLDAIDYGDQAPQPRGPLAAAGAMSEDCLRINVWTPGLDGARRPVMVWFHGGGFEAGSGSSPLYDGARLSRRGDVVVATINHRLNVFGHCRLDAAWGERFAQSGNVGYLDLVAALTWVRENIAAFGGDPGNVMIFGQSGGGRKVSLCYAGAPAEGLFHKGAIQSGSHLRIQTEDQATALTGELLKTLGLPRGDAARLQAVPMDALIAAASKVNTAMNYRFSPVLDGATFKEHPFLPKAPARSRHLPLMVGFNRTELTSQMGRIPGIFELDEAGMVQRLKTFIPEADIPEAVATFRRSRPQANPSETFFTISSARGYGLDSILLAEQRVKLAAAPTYAYRLMWRSPVEGGRRVTQHSLDLPFVFDNVADARGQAMAGPETDETRAMARAMAESWIAFARKGDPNNPAIPAWRPYDLTRRATMMFDVPSRAVEDPFPEERKFIARYPSQQMDRTLHRLDL